MMPFQVSRFRANRAGHGDARWLRDTLNREGGAAGPRVALDGAGFLRLDRPGG
ncbi:MAG TPA: hypothetical protein VKA13_05130 [Gammaproteobacteria bacterium]|nr:hypothetical protein [Gammaproteobacteria bacterium]